MERHNKKHNNPIRYTLFLLGLLCLVSFSVGCQKFNYIIRVQDSRTLSNINNAKVTLEVSGLPPLIKYTDNEGIAIMSLDGDRIGQVGKIVVSAEGYKDYTRNFEIRDGEIPPSFRLESENSSEESIAVNDDTEYPSEATATVTPTLTLTPVPNTPTHTPTLIQPTASLTATSEPTATPTVSYTPTRLPIATPSQSFYKVDLPTSNWINIYTKPSEEEGLPRAQLSGGDIVEKLEQNEDGSWYRIRIVKNGIEGWIEVNVLIPVDDNMVITLTPSSTLSTSTPLFSCMTIEIEHEQIPSHGFDTIIVRYSNWPVETVNFAFEIFALSEDGAQVYLVYPTSTDTGTPFYEIAYTVFEDKGFAPNASFTYKFQAQGSNGQVLCIKEDNFLNP